MQIQSRVTAYWPDGSYKWTAHTGNARELGEHIEVVIESKNNRNTRNSQGIRIEKVNDSYQIDNGVMQLAIPTIRTTLIECITIHQREVLRNATAVLQLEEPVQYELKKGVVTHEYMGELSNVFIEEQGQLGTILKYGGINTDR